MMIECYCYEDPQKTIISNFLQKMRIRIVRISFFLAKTLSLQVLENEIFKFEEQICDWEEEVA